MHVTLRFLNLSTSMAFCTDRHVHHCKGTNAGDFYLYELKDHNYTVGVEDVDFLCRKKKFITAQYKSNGYFTILSKKKIPTIIKLFLQH